MCKKGETARSLGMEIIIGACTQDMTINGIESFEYKRAGAEPAKQTRKRRKRGMGMGVVVVLESHNIMQRKDLKQYGMSV